MSLPIHTNIRLLIHTNLYVRHSNKILQDYKQQASYYSSKYLEFYCKAGIPISARLLGIWYFVNFLIRPSKLRNSYLKVVLNKTWPFFTHIIHS